MVSKYKDEFKLRAVNFETTGKYDFPKLLPSRFELSDKRLQMVGYNDRYIFNRNASKALDAFIGHGFLEDYHLAPLFVHAHRNVEYIRMLSACIEPNFSVYTDWPLAINIYNTYRTRWVGRFWQTFDIDVIPAPNWSDNESLDYVFDGIPQNQTVCVRVPVFATGQHMDNFITGYEEMLHVLKPRLILTRGRLQRFKTLADLTDRSNIEVRTFVSGNLRNSTFNELSK